MNLTQNQIDFMQGYMQASGLQASENLLQFIAILNLDDSKNFALGFFVGEEIALIFKDNDKPEISLDYNYLSKRFSVA